MATSGSINLTVDRDTIITEALEHLGVLAEGDTPNSDMLTACSRTLNYMVKSWQSRGLPLFAMQRRYLFLTSDVNEYVLTTSGARSTTSMVHTALNGAQDAAATSMTVDSITGISASDVIGVEQTDGTMHWTTVSGAPTGTTVVLAAGLASAAPDDAAVYTYTTAAGRPFKIAEPMFVRSKSKIDTPVELVSRQDFANLSDKQADGRINTAYYDPQVGSPTLFVWPQTDKESDFLVFWTNRTLDDFDAATDDADFPQEWFEALSFNLALRLGPKYGVSSESFNQIRGIAAQALLDAEASDTEGDLRVEVQHGR